MAKNNHLVSADILASLSNLKLSQNEMVDAQKHINQILHYVKKINQLNLENTPTTNQVTQKTNQWRDDKVTPSLSQEEVLRSANKTHQGYFVVPAILKNDQ